MKVCVVFQTTAENLPNILARCTQGEYQLLEVKKFEFQVNKTN